MKRSFLLIFLLSSAISFGQINRSKTKKSNEWRVGGTAAFNFGGNNYFGFSIAPFVGYRVSAYVEPGITAGYLYSKDDFIKQNLFHFGPYLNIYPIDNLFLRTQYEYYFGKLESETIDYSQDISENALWVGGGYRSGGSVQLFLGLMYNVFYDENSSFFSSALRPIAGVSIRI
ncbi:MAG TPA: hypothetical protein VFM82_05630 [Flavobacteriaceae bacterium]|nr:hypothetical protein [Flavobacteriaceae bacterium]